MAPKYQPLFYSLCAGALCLFVLSACGKDSAPVLGTLERDRIELIAEQQEPVVEIMVKEGERVTAQQPILRMDDRHASQSLQAAQARLTGAEGVLRTAGVNLGRARVLTKQGLASRSELDKAVSDESSARAERDAAQANVEGFQVTLDRLVVLAPRDGVIDSLPFKLGGRPPAGGVVAVLLAGTPYARVYVPEALRSQVTPGTAASIHVDGQTQIYAGRVRTVATDAAFTPYFALTERDRGRLAYLAEVDLTDAAAQKLPSGIPVTVDFPVSAQK